MKYDVLATIKEFPLPSGVHRLVLAVSGGADSMALAHGMMTVFPGYHYVIAHLNHGLRAEAAAEAALVAEFAQAHGGEFALAERDIVALAAQRGQGLEETGREERYRFFRSLKGDLIFTAHHRDDNAETVLLHLTRGCGLKGLCGMAPLEGEIARPLLSLPKAALEEYCREQGIPYVTDSSNADIRYTRNKLRMEVLPLLKEINPNITEALNRLAQTAAEDEAVLAALAVEFIEGHCRRTETGVEIDRAALLNCAPAVAKRVLLRLCDGLGIFLAAENAALLLTLPNGKQMPLNREYRAYAAAEILTLCPEKAAPAPLFWEIPFADACYTDLDGYELRTEIVPRPQKGEAAACGFFPYRYWEKGSVPALRHRRTGDWVRLPNGHKKKLSDVLIDAKVPGYCRDDLLVLAAEDEIMWILGLRLFAAGEGRCLRISFTKK